MSVETGRALSLAIVLTLALGVVPAAARHKVDRKREHGEIERIAKEPFGDIPKGPLQIFISINQQKLHLYSDGVHVADTSVATGVPSLPTPLGVFSVIQKQIFHRSNLYSNAPMPFMQRITWSGVAIHEGESIGHPASHGCIRMPHDFAVRMYRLTRLGVPVIIARPELKPVEFADPHLFVHRDKSPEQVAAAPAAMPPTQRVDEAQTAQASADSDPADAAAKTAELGLRGSNQAGAEKTRATANLAKPRPAAPPGEVKAAPASKAPIAIFISRKEKKIFARQDFAPLFDAPVTIADPDKALGTHVFTALAFTGDDRTTLRWDVVSLPEPAPPTPKAERERRSEKYSENRHRIEERDKATGERPLPQTPVQALSRIQIPQDAVDVISQSIVPGSSLIVSDEGLGDETGEGTNFIVVTH